jgi:hypothetical protein
MVFEGASLSARSFDFLDFSGPCLRIVRRSGPDPFARERMGRLCQVLRAPRNAPKPHSARRDLPGGLTASALPRAGAVLQARSGAAA